MARAEVLERAAGAESDDYGEQAETADRCGVEGIGYGGEGEGEELCEGADAYWRVFICEYGSRNHGGEGGGREEVRGACALSSVVRMAND